MSNWYLIVLVIIAAAGIFFLLRSRNAGAARREVERRAESRPAAGPRRGSRRRSARQYERRGTSLGDGELTAESGDSGAARHADRVTPVTPQHGSGFFNRPGRCRYGIRGPAAPPGGLCFAPVCVALSGRRESRWRDLLVQWVQRGCMVLVCPRLRRQVKPVREWRWGRGRNRWWSRRVGESCRAGRLRPAR